MITSTPLRQIARRPHARLLLAVLVMLVCGARDSGRRPAQAVSNPIVVENNLTGTLDSWDISGAGDPSIQGFATDISVNTGETVFFKIKTDAPAYTIDIYRLGYYGGAGARKLATVQPSRQPAAVPAGVPHRRKHRPRRLRQLEPFRVVVDGGRRVGHLPGQADPRPAPAAPATSCSSCATMGARPTWSCRPRIPRGRPTTATAAAASTAAARSAMRAAHT